ncbi:MAG: Bug family tripartite tricarboxylate transporter substrate binding protein [Lautropia sp.]
MLAEVIGKELGQPVVVENKPGAGSAIGTEAGVRSADAHTFLMGSTSMTILPSLRADLPYQVMRDLKAVGMVSAQPLVLSVAADSPLKSVADILAASRASDKLTAGNSGNGSLSHLTTELFNIRNATRIVPVAYKGESALTPDLVSGVTSMAFLNLPSALPLLKAGRLRALAVTAPGPVDALPDVKTMKALGFDDFVIEGWAALYAAGNVPADGVARMSTLLAKALGEPAVRARFEGFGVEPRAGTAAELDAFTRAEIARWGGVIRSRGIAAR